MLVRLIKKGVNVVPAIHIHSSSKYVEMVKLIVVEYRLNVCIRTSDIDGGVDRFKMNAEKIFEILAIDTSRIILLLDLGYVKMEIINSLSAATKNAIKSLKTPVSNWLNIVVAAGSFPEDLTYVKNPNPNKLPRHEWEIWKHIHKDPDLLLVNYGDFGTKYPMLKDVALFAPTVSLKYTTEEYFIIYKGLKSEDHPNGHGQYITHASNIVKSRDYSGKTFSWGDLKIYEISNENIANNKRKTGSSTTWVQISQNHHISLINSLL